MRAVGRAQDHLDHETVLEELVFESWAETVACAPDCPHDTVAVAVVGLEKQEDRVPELAQIGELEVPQR